MTPQPVTAFDPSSYPGPRPSGPVLVLEGVCRPLALTMEPARPWLRPARAPVCAATERPSRLRWSLAYGANASPQRLAAKGLDRRGAVLLPARITGWAPVFEQRRTSYGAVPVTLLPVAGRSTATWVLGIDVADTVVLDTSEGRAGSAGGSQPADGHRPPPGTYRLGVVGEVVVAGRFLLCDTLAYLPGPQTRVQVDGGGALRCWPEVTQPQARAHLAAEGPSRTVGTSVDVRTVLGPWPATPLLRAHRSA